MSLLTTVRSYISRHQLLPAGARVVVGVSGGPDSLVLLHVLHRLASDGGWLLHVAHLHHGMRADADADARFVAAQAAALGLGCTLEQVHVPHLAAAAGLSLEEAARQARYHFLGRVALRLGADVVAVGHHADDQAETIVMHLLRGSGLAGLRGMLPSTPLDALQLPDATQFAGVLLVRPFLSLLRDDIIAYARANALHPRQDASNRDESFFRNHLRHSVMPLLATLNPKLSRTLSHTAAALQGDYQALAVRRDALWQAMAQVERGRVRLPLAAFRNLLPGDQRALLRRAMQFLRPQHRNLGWEHTERVVALLQDAPQRASGGPYTLTAGLVVWLSYQWLDVQEVNFAASDAPQVHEEQYLPLPGQIALGSGWQLQARAVRWSPEMPPWQQHAGPDVIWLPMDVPVPLRVRARRAGERIMLLGMGADKALKDVMNALKMPRALRWQWPLLVNAHDEILWIVGRRAGAGAHVSVSSGQAWEIRLRENVRPAVAG
jgi:tRNA(Ile)-lysidine synthetase-like protein